MSALVLDLDSTLIYTINHNNRNELDLYNYIKSKYPDMVYKLDFPDGYNMYGYFRPYLQEFLEDTRKYFDYLIVYTAGTYDYGITVAKLLEREFGIKFDRILTREECLKLNSGIFLNKDDYSKPLTIAFPDLDIKQMLIVDDKMCNFRFNPRNGILIPAYSPMTENEVLSDEYLEQLRDWLINIEILNSPDFRLLNKDNIFDVQVLANIF